MSNGGRNPGDRGEAVLAIFQRGADFMKQLMDENESLRKQLADVHGRQEIASQSDEDWDGLRKELADKIANLESERENIMAQLRSVESENQQFAERYLEAVSSARFNFEGEEVVLAASVGVVEADAGLEEASQLMRAVHAARTEAKNAGGGCVRVHGGGA